MRYILYIFFLLSCWGSQGQTNFSSYGATGDGVADDTAELQAALNATGNLIADPGAIFKISSTLNITQGFAHTINWNGATIITTNNLNPMIFVNKRSSNGGSTTMSNLIVDGNGNATKGIHAQSRLNLTNVDITDFYQTTGSSPAGVYIQIYNDADCHGNWVLDNVNITETVGASNGIITDSWGASNSMLLYWQEVPSSATNVTIQNGSMNNSWGEDSGLLYILDQTGNSISGSLGTVTVKNMDFYDSERRAVKGFCGNVTFEDSTFTDPSPSDPDIQEGTKSGLVVFGGNSLMSNIKFDNCEFVSRGYDGRVIGINAEDVEIRNSVFKSGADLAFTTKIGDVLLCNNVWETGGSIYGYNINDSTGYIGTISVGTNNTGPSGYVQTPSGKTAYVTCSSSGVPIISLIGDSVINLDVDDTYTEFGATASDPEDGDITGDIIITGTVNTASAGTYYKYYNVTDSNGNTAPQKTRTIVVSESSEGDTTPPTITSVIVNFLTSTSVNVTWYLDEASQGGLEYGTTDSYGSTTPYETGYLTGHSQTISGLEYGTTYHYNIIGEDLSGNEISVQDRTFTTLADPDPEPEEPLWMNGLQSRFLKLNKF